MPSIDTQHSSGVRERIRVKEPDMYDVILINDDFTTMDCVVRILCDVFYHSSAKANEIMLSVHNSGSGVAGTFTLDIAESKKAKAESLARKEGFPLRVEVKKHV